MGSRRGFICRMRMGNTHVDPMTANHTVRIRQRNTLGPTPDGNHFAVVHVTGYIKNWPPANKGVLSFQSQSHYPLTHLTFYGALECALN